MSNDVINALRNHVAQRRMQVRAADGGLKVLTDDGGFKLANRLFKQFVSESEYGKFPTFMQELDELLFKYRGEKPITDDEVEQFSDKLEEDTDDEDTAGSAKVDLEEKLEDESTVMSFVLASVVR